MFFSEGKTRKSIIGKIEIKNKNKTSIGMKVLFLHSGISVLG